MYLLCVTQFHFTATLELQFQLWDMAKFKTCNKCKILPELYRPHYSGTEQKMTRTKHLLLFPSHKTVLLQLSPANESSIPFSFSNKTICILQLKTVECICPCVKMCILCL